MSRKVTMKSSMVNRPTCGGPRKAGLAPRSTNFMMGVKRNHHFRGTPFAGKAADYPDKCRGESSGSSGGVLLGSGSSDAGNTDVTPCNQWCKQCCNKLKKFSTCEKGKCNKNNECEIILGTIRVETFGTEESCNFKTTDG